MRINEAALAIGVSTKNIRFYESEGLLSPQRNRENNYRDYSDGDVRRLRQIKLLRKLAVPIEDIRALLGGSLTLPEAMQRQTSRLEDSQRNIEQSRQICAQLQSSGLALGEVDTAAFLDMISTLEAEGRRFMNIHKNDEKKRIAAPVVAAALMIVLMAAIAGLMVWGFLTDPAGAPPLVLVIIITALPLAVIAGVVIALIQRLKELKGGEIDAAGKY